LARSVLKGDQPAASRAGNTDTRAESIGPPPPAQEITKMTDTRKIAWLALPLCCLLTAPSMAAGLDDGLPGLDVRREDRQADRQLDRRADRQLDRRADRQLDRRVDRQADRRADRVAGLSGRRR